MSQSTNFNTADMKVCFFDVKDDKETEALDDGSLGKLMSAINYAFKRTIKKNNNIKCFVVINPSVIFGEKEYSAFVSHLNKMKAKIISTVGDTIVVESEEEYYVSVQMVGGARFIADYVKNESDASDESDFEDANNMGLTQECNIG